MDDNILHASAGGSDPVAYILQNNRYFQQQFASELYFPYQFVYFLGPDLTPIDVKGWVDFSGIKPEEVADKSWLNLAHPDDREVAEKLYTAVFTDRRIYSGTFRILRKDGVYRMALIRSGPVYDNNSNHLGWIGVFADVTEQYLLNRQIEDSLQALFLMSEMLLTSAHLSLEEICNNIAEIALNILQIKSISVSFIDPKTGFLQPIASAGSTVPRLKRWKERIPKINIGEFPPDELKLLGSGQCFPKKFQLEPVPEENDSGERWVLMTPILLGNELIGLYTMEHFNPSYQFGPDSERLAKNIAHIFAITAQYDRLHKNQLLAEEISMNEIAARKKMDDFLKVISHDLRSPLTSIKTTIEYAKLKITGIIKHPEDAEKHIATLQKLEDMLIRANNQCDVELRLINDLVVSGQIESDTFDISFSQVNIVELTATEVNNIADSYPDRIIRLVILPDATILLVTADAIRLKQVLTNFIMNALKFSKESEPVEIVVSENAEEVKVTVIDFGIGIPSDELNKIWEHLYKSQSGKQKPYPKLSVGLGLGLFICKEIIEAHHGAVGVESEVGKGSSFWFSLPLAKPQLERKPPKAL